MLMRLCGRRVLGPARVALLPPAAFAVHQLRYELAYGSRAGAELHATGHSYLHSLVPWLVLLIGLAVGSFLGRLGRAYARRSSPREFSLSFAAAWATCAAALILIFFCQETLEGWFAAAASQRAARRVRGWGLVRDPGRRRNRLVACRRFSRRALDRRDGRAATLAPVGELGHSARAAGACAAGALGAARAVAWRVV